MTDRQSTSDAATQPSAPTMGPFLRTLRSQSGRSQAQQADLLSQLSGRPVTRNEVSRWENEARLLTPYWQAYTAASFGIQATELRNAVSASRAERRRREANSGAESSSRLADGFSRAVEPEDPAPGEGGFEKEDDDVRRREILTLASGTVVASLLSALEPARRLADTALALPATESDAEEWDLIADEYARLVGRNPTAWVLPQLLIDFDEVRARVESAGEVLRSRLARAHGLLSALIAISLVEAGHPLEANRYWRTAERAAQLVNDRQFSSLIRGRRAVFATYGQSSHRSILNLADHAISTANGAACAGTVSAHAARAQIYAQERDHSAARVALLDLENTFERLPDTVINDRESQWGWSEQRLRHVQSFVYSFAGRAREASVAQDAALALYPPSSYLGPAQVRLHRAIWMIATGDPSEGVRHVIQTLETVPPNLRDDRLVRHTASLALETLPGRATKSPAARQAYELTAPSTGAS